MTGHTHRLEQLADARLGTPSDGQILLYDAAQGKWVNHAIPQAQPLSHAASHASGGTDPLTPAAIGAATSGHGHDSTYARLAADNALTGKQTITRTGGYGQLTLVNTGSSAAAAEAYFDNTAAHAQNKAAVGMRSAGTTTPGRFYIWVNDAERLTIETDGTVKIGGNTVWHAGNDGSGSGLDADYLDGRNASTIAVSNTIAQRDTDGSLSANRLISTVMNEFSTDPPIGVTSTTRCPNLNADLIDGKHAADFSESGHSHTTPNRWTYFSTAGGSVLTTTASTKMTLSNLTPVGTWMVTAICDFSITGATGTALGELYLNASIQSGAIVFSGASGDRVTASQTWLVTTTATTDDITLRVRSLAASTAKLTETQTSMYAIYLG